MSSTLLKDAALLERQGDNEGISLIRTPSLECTLPLNERTTVNPK
jgi:hypothetical protein